MKTATKAATSWIEMHEAQQALDETFGTVFTADKDELQRQLSISLAMREDLSKYTGPDSAFKFPDIGTHIILRSVVSVEHETLTTLVNRVAKLEKDLKAAKAKLKAKKEQLVLAGKAEPVITAVTPSFTELK